ncbi:MAG: glycosyltransferase family 4 protein [Chloroflexia bacterium]|nr:glycosyltransferase family 4 protein [Chloroflexia bacterium]
MNTYDLLVPISNEDASFYQQLGNKLPVKVIPVGFDFSGVKYEEEKLLPDKLFYIGSLEWRPNQEGLIWFLDNCWTAIKKEHPQVKLYVAGRNSPKWLEQKLKDCEVNFVGEVDSSADFIEDKGIMIVPLLSGSGMRIKIVEAFMNSKAVVTTRVGAKGIPAIDNVHLLIANESVDFAKKVMKLITDVNVLKSLTKNAFIFAKEHFDNEIISRELYEFYKANIN